MKNMASNDLFLIVKSFSLFHSFPLCSWSGYKRFNDSGLTKHHNVFTFSFPINTTELIKEKYINDLNI